MQLIQRLPAPQTAPLAATSPAWHRVWLRAEHFFSRQDARAHCWLWLRDECGIVRAWRMDAAALGRDDRIRELLQQFRATPNATYLGDPVLGRIWPLPNAPVVPMTRWAISWGQPVQGDIRAFADSLDQGILETLGALELAGTFLGSVANFNRLARLSPSTSRHRQQALRRFPPLLIPVLLDLPERPDMFGTELEEHAGHRHAPSPALLEAMDHGRDLIGALAQHYAVDRALIRSPLMAEPWPDGAVAPETLQLLQALPAHTRPRDLRCLPPRLALLAAAPIKSASRAARARLAPCFADGWDRVWRRLETEFSPLEARLRDCRDFLQAVLQQAEMPPPLAWFDVPMLGHVWAVRRGLKSLLAASRRWHAQALTPVSATLDGIADSVPALFGAWENAEGKAIELTTAEALREEGECMHHCVGGYWEQCLYSATRIVHLELLDGRAATAQFEFDGLDEANTLLLVQLRGRHNGDCDADMYAFAEDAVEMLNADTRRDARCAALADAAQQSARRRPDGPRHVRRLDARSRAEARMVLDFAMAQPTWQRRGGASYSGSVAGFVHAEGPRLLGVLRVGAELQLVREPHNPYDPLAVRIDWQGHKLGYVPRAANAPIAAALDQGLALAARIDAIDPNPHWREIRVDIGPAG
ncbi:MAG TPA: HIRAN domain-containing protein [Rhodanobacteraceae bacterium]|nr:HIRAN domain-containing protein [Rhodanobacteraceae bacterium]